MWKFLKNIFESQPEIVAVVAMSRKDRGIGADNQLLWHIPDDLKRFKQLTLGHPIIMGRKTFESIITQLGKPLPDRQNIVLTGDVTYQPEGVEVTDSLQSAIDKARLNSPSEIHIGGGAMIYEAALPLVDKLYVTWIDAKAEADTFFPSFENEFAIEKAHEPREHNGVRYQWIDYKRK